MSYGSVHHGTDSHTITEGSNVEQLLNRLFHHVWDSCQRVCDLGLHLICDHLFSAGEIESSSSSEEGPVSTCGFFTSWQSQFAVILLCAFRIVSKHLFTWLPSGFLVAVCFESTPRAVVLIAGCIPRQIWRRGLQAQRRPLYVIVRRHSIYDWRKRRGSVVDGILFTKVRIKVGIPAVGQWPPALRQNRLRSGWSVSPKVFRYVQGRKSARSCWIER